MRQKLYKFITNIVSAHQSQVLVHARAFVLNILKATSKCIYISSLKQKIFKIVKVMTVSVVFFNARASRAPTCMHVLSCKYDSSIL